MPTKTTSRSVRVRKPVKRRKTKVTKTTSVRLDMRVEPRAKALIERAAALTGQTITDFAVSNLVEFAMATIERHERLMLSDRDRDRFLAALDRPSKPLPELAKAARLHAQITTCTLR